jgi:hypothetical protein
MNRIRLPYFVLAVIIILAVVLIERGAVQAAEAASRLPPFLLGGGPVPMEQATAIFPRQQQIELNRLLSATSQDDLARLRKGDLSGFGVRSLQYVDALLLFTMILMAMVLFIPRLVPHYTGYHAKLQGIVTLIFSIIMILAAIVFLLYVIARLVIMITLLLSFPFGTLVFLIIYGHFPRAAMTAVLSLIFFLKILFGALLILAHQDFIKNLTFVLYILASLAANLIVAFLYGIVPGILVSITDAIAAVVVIIFGIILELMMAIGAVVSIFSAFKPASLLPSIQAASIVSPPEGI